ncbi:uncharacterized protein LOC127790687 isoform X2 [Diospyros lotus]|uniref:uncharacterized protein LOC127790687 isoform X2 n=1 Tax=Diospyros lotus TaxID=55363 RepID=UPI00224FA27E|nr:uncharacterized protein LOC127790687 isoform X2 [Diospyros lotus]
MASARKWAAIISYIASRAYFYLIILQVPLFRVACSRVATCTTPLEVASCQLIRHQICPAVLVKALLYPGAVLHTLLNSATIPSFKEVYNPLILKNPNPAFVEPLDLRLIEVYVGSYLAVGGALLGALRPGGRMSLGGTLLVVWGLSKELFLGRNGVSLYPTLFIAPILAFLSIRRDVRKLIRCFKARRQKTPIRSFKLKAWKRV